MCLGSTLAKLFTTEQYIKTTFNLKEIFEDSLAKKMDSTP